MVKRTVIIKSVDSAGNEYQKAITNVNPETTPQQIDTFDRAFNALSLNTYIDSLRVDTESVNEALEEE